jgi:hypothetical protein
MSENQADYIDRLTKFFNYDWDMSELNDKDETHYLLVEELQEGV